MNALILIALTIVTLVNPGTKPIDPSPDGSAKVIFIASSQDKAPGEAVAENITEDTTPACIPAPQLSDYLDDEGTPAEKWADYGLALRYWETLPNRCI